MKDQQISVNVHSPQVNTVYRLEESGTVVVNLGNNGYRGTVAMFIGDDESNWNTIDSAVRLFFQNERNAADPSGELYCGDCSYIAIDSADLTEHAAINHEAEK